MKITVYNPETGKAIHFLDQTEINAVYGAEKITLDTQDFINDRVLNLYAIGGDGGLFALPQNFIDSYNRNFTQNKVYLSNTYNIRTIELTSSIPALILSLNSNISTIINQVVGHDQYTLKMLVDRRNDGGKFLEIASVGCQQSPLTNDEFKFVFEVYGDSVDSFLGVPKISILSPLSTGGELKYPKKYPIKYQEGDTQIVQITNNSGKVFDTIVIFEGECVNPRLTNTVSGNYSSYGGVMQDGDNVVINSANRTLKKNGVSELVNLVGTFLKIENGQNRFKFTCDSFDVTNPPICIIEYREKFSGA